MADKAMNLFGTRDTLNVGGKQLYFYNLNKLQGHDVSRLPVSIQVLLQRVAGLTDRGTDGRHIAECVEQAVVVNQAVVAGHGDLHAGLVELAAVGFAFVAQDIQFGGLDQGRRQALELLHAGLQWRGVDLAALRRVGGDGSGDEGGHRGGDGGGEGADVGRTGVDVVVGDPQGIAAGEGLGPGQQLEEEKARTDQAIDGAGVSTPARAGTTSARRA